VAGASRGIGLAIAQQLAEAGARTMTGGAIHRQIAGARPGAGSPRVSRQARCASIWPIPAPSARPWEHIGTPDILVNAAGTNIRKSFPQYTQAEYEHIMRTNLHGIVELTQQIGARMIAARRGRQDRHDRQPDVAAGPAVCFVYAMTKGALGQLTKALAAEWGRYNIQVNCIAPGFIVTDLNRRMWEPARMREWLKGAQANPRLGAPDDIAPLAVFLAGRGADYITGQIIAVDGGYTTTAVWPFEPEL
jgi:gluconate 5-dehydrogenase